MASENGRGRFHHPIEEPGPVFINYRGFEEISFTSRRRNRRAPRHPKPSHFDLLDLAAIDRHHRTSGKSRTSRQGRQSAQACRHIALPHYPPGPVSRISRGSLIWLSLPALLVLQRTIFVRQRIQQLRVAGDDTSAVGMSLRVAIGTSTAHAPSGGVIDLYHSAEMPSRCGEVSSLQRRPSWSEHLSIFGPQLGRVLVRIGERRATFRRRQHRSLRSGTHEPGPLRVGHPAERQFASIPTRDLCLLDIGSRHRELGRGAQRGLRDPPWHGE